MPRVLLLLVALSMVTSCASRATYTRPQKITGTCAGACDHYLSCKGEQSDRTYQACLQTCPFAEGESAAAFEQLTCEAAIGFVEGEGGRQPGHPAHVTSKVAR